MQSTFQVKRWLTKLLSNLTNRLYTITEKNAIMSFANSPKFQNRPHSALKERCNGTGSESYERIPEGR